MSCDELLKRKRKGENAYSINRKARRTETSVCVCVEKHGWILHIGKKKRNGEVANVYGLVMKREKNREMHHQSAKAKLLSLGGKTKEMSAIFTSIGSDRDNCCASSRSKKKTVLISGGNK